MGLEIRAKVVKYVSKGCYLLAIAATLTRMFKTKLVEYYYTLGYGNTIWERIKEFCDGNELCNLYSICSTLVQACRSFPSTNCDSSGKLHSLIMFFCETPQAHAITSNLE